VPDLSTLVSVVNNVAGDETLAEEAKPFLDAIQDPAAEVTAFAPVNAAFEPLEGVEFNPAAVLMFHAVPGMMEAGKAYDTAAGPDAGQLVVNEAGDTVTGPCNSANVSLSVDVCGSVAHVIDAVLLPASFCADSAQTEVGEDEDEDEHDGDHDHDHDHDGEDHDDDKDGDLESEDDAGADDAAPENPADAAFAEGGTADEKLQAELSGGLVSDQEDELFDIDDDTSAGGSGRVEGTLEEATIIDAIAEATSPEEAPDEVGGTAEDDLEDLEEGGDEEGESIDEEITEYFEEGR